MRISEVITEASIFGRNKYKMKANEIIIESKMLDPDIFGEELSPATIRTIAKKYSVKLTLTQILYSSMIKMTDTIQLRSPVLTLSWCLVLLSTTGLLVLTYKMDSPGSMQAREQ